MDVSKKIESLGDVQVQKVLRQIDEEELAFVAAGQLSELAIKKITINMSERAIDQLQIAIQRNKRALGRLEKLVDEQLAEKVPK